MRTPTHPREVYIRAFADDQISAHGAVLSNEACKNIRYHLTPRAPFENVRVKVGDWVRLCYNGRVRNEQAFIGYHPGWEVLGVCPFRGVRAAGEWHRSWIVVKLKEDRT